jgi:predicted DNA-binding transcriptional regulator YafY
MSDLKEKLKRQTEILGLCLHKPGEVKQTDLELIFKRDKPTITRDLTSLRSGGIDIHSTKKGVRVEGKIKPEILTEVILQYIGLSYSSFSYDKATVFLVKRLKERALVNIVMLQQSIDLGRLVMIEYEKEPGTVDPHKIIAPLMLYQTEGEWRLLAIHDGIQKQYLLYKIKGIVQTAKTFKKPSMEKLRYEFETSWNSWLSGSKYSVVLRFDHEAMKRYGQKQFVEEQRFIRQPDGSCLFEASVNSLNEIAAWVVSRGTGIEAVEPPELRALIVSLAKSALKLHS